MLNNASTASPAIKPATVPAIIPKAPPMGPPIAEPIAPPTKAPTLEDAHIMPRSLPKVVNALAAVVCHDAPVRTLLYIFVPTSSAINPYPIPFIALPNGDEGSALKES